LVLCEGKASPGLLPAWLGDPGTKLLTCFLSIGFLLQVVVECKVSAICVFCKHRLNNLLY